MCLINGSIIVNLTLSFLLRRCLAVGNLSMETLIVNINLL